MLFVRHLTFINLSATRKSKEAVGDQEPLPPIKVQEVKGARSLASDITQRGAKLFDLLSTESTERYKMSLSFHLI